MSYYDDYVDDAVTAALTTITNTTGRLGPIDSSGNIRGVFAGKAPVMLIVLLVVGLIAQGIRLTGVST